MILALESSTQLGSVALIHQGQVLFEKSSTRQKSHSEFLNVFVDEAFKNTGRSFSDLKAVAIGQGPGSFTGLRVAGNIGKTICYSYSLPFVSINSLEILAAQMTSKNLPVLSIINAYKNMVYFGFYDVSKQGLPICLSGPGVIPVKELSSILKFGPFQVCGDGFDFYKSYFDEKFFSLATRHNAVNDFPTASCLARLAENKALTLDWKSYLPLYIRASEAEENKKGVLFTPLS